MNLYREWENQLHKRSELHLLRKIWHVFGVLAIFAIVHLTPESALSWVVIGAWFFVVGVDFIRLRSEKMNQIALRVFRPFLRDSEIHHMAGTTALFTGVGITLLFFNLHIASLSILFLAFADPLASYFGIKYGKDKIFGHKSLQGVFAAFVTCFLISLGYFSWVYDLNLRWFALSILCGLIGAVAEAVPIGELDDNLTMPIVSASLLWIFFYFFQVGI